MGMDVTMFFTFWGLSALRKENVTEPPSKKKSFLQKAFGSMLPKGPEKLGISKFNFGGAGQSMMKKVMKAENVMTVAELLQTAKEQGIKMVACTMSMDVMGLREEELMDGLEFAGVGSYLGEADEANVNLFI